MWKGQKGKKKHEYIKKGSNEIGYQRIFINLHSKKGFLEKDYEETVQFIHQ